MEKMEAELDFRLWMLRKAEKNLKLFERRWEKKKKTYWAAGGKYSVYDDRSVVKRVETRLLEADAQLEAATVRMSMRSAPSAALLCRSARPSRSHGPPFQPFGLAARGQGSVALSRCSVVHPRSTTIAGRSGGSCV